MEAMVGFPCMRLLLGEVAASPCSSTGQFDMMFKPMKRRSIPGFHQAPGTLAAFDGVQFTA